MTTTQEPTTTSFAPGSLPFTVVHLGLAAVRLPLTLAEAVLGKSGDQQWPPALLFERVESQVALSVGNLIGDAALTDDGRRRQTRASLLEKAVALDEQAAFERTEAGEQLRFAHDQIAERRTAASRATAAARSATRRSTTAAKQQAAATAEREATQRKAADRERDEFAARRQRTAELGAVEAERKALAKDERAARAHKTAAVTAKKAAAAKRARKA